MATICDLRQTKNFKGKAPWQVRYRTSTKVPKTKCFATKKEAEDFRAAIDAELTKLKHGLLPDWYFQTKDPGDLEMTVGELAGKYKAAEIDTRKKEGARTSAWAQLKYIVGDLADVRALSLTKNALKEWEGRRRNGHAVRTVRGELTALKAVYRWGVEFEHLPHNPIEGYRLPKRDEAEEQEARFLEDEELETLLDAFKPKPEMYGPVVLQVNTGMRIAEVLSLTWRQVDLKGKKKRIHIPKEKCKGGKIDRWVPLNPAALKILRPLFLARPYGEQVFKPRRVAKFCDSFTRIADKALEEHTTTHCLRHTWAFRYMRGKRFLDQDRVPRWEAGSLKGCARIGGWSESSPVLLKIYSHVEQEREERGMENVSIGGDGFMKDVKKPKKVFALQR